MTSALGSRHLAGLKPYDPCCKRCAQFPDKNEHDEIGAQSVCTDVGRVFMLVRERMRHLLLVTGLWTVLRLLNVYCGRSLQTHAVSAFLVPRNCGGRNLDRSPAGTSGLLESS